MPAAASANAVLTANPGIAAAFGSSPPILAMEEVGGAYAAGAVGSQTSPSTLDFDVLLHSNDITQDLLLGFYGGQAIGTGVTSVALNVQANGISLVNTSFASTGAAAAYFNNNTFDAGSLAGTVYTSGSLDLTVTLQVRSAKAGSGFYGGIIVSG